MIFIEKYKGKEFDDIIGYGDKIKSLCQDDNIPHLLFYGNPGVGKSLSAEIIIKQLDLNYIKLNASDERGIDIIRGKLRDFAMSRSSNGKTKVIWLDEFDKLTPDAYDALRGFLEEFQTTTKFICTCNYIYNIPDAIRDRFTEIEFKNPSIEDIVSGLLDIIVEEEIGIDKDTTIELIKSCNRSVRSSINKLELLSKLNRKIELSDIKNDMSLIEDIHNLLKQRKFPDARQKYLNASIDSNDFLKDYHDYIIELSIAKGELSPDVTKKIIEIMFECIDVMGRSAIKEICIEWYMLKLMELL